VLAMPRSRAQALAIQEALREPQLRPAGKAVGWLVRASGPGRRGETLRLTQSRVRLGRSTTCEILLSEDTRIAEQHASIMENHGRFTIEPLQGLVKVEDRLVDSAQLLNDGDTIEIGESRFVWKHVNLL